MRLKMVRFGKIGMAAFLCGCLTFVGTLGVSSVGALAQETDVFTIRDVPVDASAGEATEARTIAIRQGRALALRFLFQRLTTRTDWPLMPTLSTSEVTSMGAGFEVSGEKNSSTRYLATITYRFKPDDVRRVLRENGIPFSESRARPAVILPVVVLNENLMVWDDANMWQLQWLQRNYSNELVPLIMPLGDLGDALAAPIEAITSGNYYGLTKFAERYGVQDVVIVGAVHQEHGAPLRLEVARLTPTGTDGFIIDQPIGEDVLKGYDLAIDRIIERLQEDWKAKTIIRYGEREEITAVAEFASFKEWLSIRQALDDTPNIVGSEVIALSTGTADLLLSAVGTTDQLSLALAQHNVLLIPAYNKVIDPMVAYCEEMKKAGIPAENCALQDNAIPAATEYTPGNEIGTGYNEYGEPIATAEGGFFDFLDDAIAGAAFDIKPDYWILRYQEHISSAMPLNDETVGLDQGFNDSSVFRNRTRDGDVVPVSR